VELTRQASYVFALVKEAIVEQLRDQNNELVGWMRLGEHIFDVDMNWIAYISNGHVWSVATGNWCGAKGVELRV
jgi:hypothetical protein